MKAYRIHSFQHAAFEDAAAVHEWPGRLGQISYTKFYSAHTDLPDPSAYDLLLIMGGPMGANDENKFSWMTEEKKAIRQAVESGKKVAGICLGAQLIASVLGAKVYKNTYKEIGWLQVSFSPDVHPVTAGFPGQMELFHWHGDTFDLPAGAILLASSEACRNQAFIYKDNILALQFHMETTAESARILVENCRDEIEGMPDHASPFVQSEKKILARTDTSEMNSFLFTMLDRLMQ